MPPSFLWKWSPHRILAAKRLFSVLVWVLMSSPVGRQEWKAELPFGLCRVVPAHVVQRPVSVRSQPRQSFRARVRSPKQQRLGGNLLSFIEAIDTMFLTALTLATTWVWVGANHDQMSFPHILSPLRTFFFFQVKSGKNERWGLLWREKEFTLVDLPPFLLAASPSYCPWHLSFENLYKAYQPSGSSPHP